MTVFNTEHWPLHHWRKYRFPDKFNKHVIRLKHIEYIWRVMKSFIVLNVLFSLRLTHFDLNKISKYKTNRMKYNIKVCFMTMRYDQHNFIMGYWKMFVVSLRFACVVDYYIIFVCISLWSVSCVCLWCFSVT